MKNCMTIEIRNELATDVDAINAVTIAAFTDAPHTGHTEQFIVKALRSTGKLSISLVAERDGEVVGHVAVSPVSISDGSTGWYGLGPISVMPACQGQGIGSRLMQAALQALRASGAAGCVVLGEPGYYGRFGFRAEPGLVLPDVPPAYFQVQAFSGSVPRGTVTYDAAFNARA